LTDPASGSIQATCFLALEMIQKKRPPNVGGPFFYLALWVLVTQLTVVSEENKQVRCSNCAILVEVFRTTVW
jgi:hypothetical protein